MAMDAFDLAERFQTLVFVMSDLDLAMNTWMSRTVRVSGAADRSRQGARRATTLARIGEWGRYKDVDGDGIPYRTIPGDRHAGVFHARLRPQRQAASTASGRTTTSTTWTGWRASSRPRGSTCRGRMVDDPPAPRSASSATAPATGRSTRAAPSSSGSRRAHRLPAAARLSVHRRARRRSSTATSAIYVVEQNRDAQMLGLMRLELRARAGRQAAQRAALQRPADRRALGHRRHPACRKGSRSGAAATRWSPQRRPRKGRRATTP